MVSTRLVPFLGRVLIGLPFLMSGLGKVAAFGATTAYISSVGLPFAPLGWAIAITAEIGGGLLLLIGFRVREVAAAMAIFTLATAAFFHNNFADQNQMIHFLKNVMIAGGPLQIVTFGGGALSIDNRRKSNGLRSSAMTA